VPVRFEYIGVNQFIKKQQQTGWNFQSENQYWGIDWWWDYACSMGADSFFVFLFR